MKIIKYFFEFLFIIILFAIFKILGLKILNEKKLVDFINKKL